VRKLVIAACIFFTSFIVFAAPASARRQTHKSAEAKKKAPAKRPSTRRTYHRRHYRHYSHRYHGPKKPTADRISEIQSALTRSGYYHGEPNGRWDSSTVDAMRKFQEDHGLDGTGKIDARSLQKLGLGSEIAGVDAPRPPVPAQRTLTPAQDKPNPAGTAPDKSKPQTPKAPDTPSGAASSSARPDVTPASSAAPPASASAKVSAPQN
jgi:Putative peptidoglycan binding domain